MSWKAYYGRMESARNLFKEHFEEVTSIPCPRLYTSRCGGEATITLHLTHEQADPNKYDEIWDALELFEEKYAKPNNFQMGWSIWKQNGSVRARPKVYLKTN